MARSHDGVGYTCPRGPDHEGECYRYVNGTDGDVNNGSKFLVIVGCDDAASNIRVKNAAGTVFDGQVFNVTSSFTAAAPTNVNASFDVPIQSVKGLNRRILCPPGFTIASPSGKNWQGVVCATIEDAIDAL